ncbi:MAG: hypothetical protein Q7R95_08505, partial [bacterium]|nr:hypothetical protein [bacterium]
VRHPRFKYFLTRNSIDYFPLFNIIPYKSDEGLIVLPESKLDSRESPVIFTYYDHLEQGKLEKYLEILDRSENFSKLKITSTPFFADKLNQSLIKSYKKLRDFKKRFN